VACEFEYMNVGIFITAGNPYVGLLPNTICSIPRDFFHIAILVTIAVVSEREHAL